MELTRANVVVVKVGTSTLTHENGKLNLRRVEMLCRVLSDLQNSGKKIVLFATSGGSGFGKAVAGLQPSAPGATIVEGAVLNGRPNEAKLKAFAE